MPLQHLFTPLLLLEVLELSLLSFLRGMQSHDRLLGGSAFKSQMDALRVTVMFVFGLFSISETQQQQRSVQAQECLCVLLQMTQLLLQPYSSMRVSLPLYEQQQILQQLLDVASANASIASVTSTSTPRPVAKQLRQQVREALLLLAATAEDRTKFLSTIHRSLIRCKNKECVFCYSWSYLATACITVGMHGKISIFLLGCRKKQASWWCED